MIRKIAPLLLLPIYAFFIPNVSLALCPNPNAANLILNGDFGSGLEQSYPFFPVPTINTILTFDNDISPSTAKYALVNSTVGSNFNWLEIGDNSTDPNGYMMLINGYLGATTTLTYTLDVCEGLEYYIGMDVINMAKTTAINFADPNLELRINGVPLFPAQSIQKETGWITLGGNYLVPPGVNSLEISLYNYTGSVIGNDFAIDNVTANLCGSDVLLNETTFAPYCPGDNFSLEATLSPVPGPTLFYQLQTSLDGGLNWTNEGPVSNANTFNLTDIPFGLSVRVLASLDPLDLASPNCAFASQPLNLNFDSPDDCFNTPISSPGIACVGELGPNIIDNGDFGSGNGQFASVNSLPSNTLNYAGDGFLDEGEFTVVNQWQGSPCIGNSAEICWLNDIQDSSGDPSAYIQLVNGGSSNEIIWSAQGIGFCGELIHTISFDVLNLANPLYAPNTSTNSENVALPEIEVILSSLGESNELIKVISTPFSTGQILNDGQWHNFSFSFLSNSFQNNLKVSLRLKGSNIQGNDVALDNISVQFCGPEIEINGPGFACENEEITITANPMNGLSNNYFFKWEKSYDGGNSWSLIPGASNADLIIAVETDVLYRVRAAYNEFNGIPSDNCFAISDPFTLDVYDTGPYPYTAVICPDEYYYIGTDSFNVDITLPYTLTSFNGCDSIVELTVVVENIPQTYLSQNICPGESVDFNGQIISEDAVYFDTLSSYLGCDSVIIFSLFVKDSNLVEQNINLCVGETFNGVAYTSDTILYEIYTNEIGCDSTIAININVSDLVDFEIYGDQFICNSMNPTTTLFVDEYAEYNWSNGSIQQSSTFAIGGNYAVTVTDDIGCEADQVFFIESINLDMDIEVTSPLCHNDPAGVISINEYTGGDEPYLFSIDSGSTLSPQPIFENVFPEEDSIMVLMMDNNGCIITQNVFVQNPDTLYLDLGEESEINIGETISISAESNQDIISIDWTPADSVNCVNCTDIELTPLLPYALTATITNEFGCTAEDTYMIEIGKRRNIYVPNIFTPNFDGVNDIFYIQGGIDVVSISELIIYDRWGNMVYYKPDVGKNVQSDGWNGRFNGNLSPSGVYSYYFLVYFTDGKSRRYEGSITLMR